MSKQFTQSNLPASNAILDPVNLGKLIKANCTPMKMTLADCASLCKVGINTLSRIENGNPNSTLEATFFIFKGPLSMKSAANLIFLILMLGNRMVMPYQWG